MKPGIIVFATGNADQNLMGTGFRNIVQASRNNIIKAEIVRVVSSHEKGSIRRIAEELGVPFTHFVPGKSAFGYRDIVEKSGAALTVLSGWLSYVTELDAAGVLNVHPATLPRFGGLYGVRLYEAVLDAFARDEITASDLTIHFVNPFGGYDTGAVCFRISVPLEKGESVSSLQKKMKDAEHRWYPWIIDKVIGGEIRLEGKILHVPAGYQYL